MATCTWNAGGADNKASTAGNWDSAPGNGDTLVIGFDARGIDWDLAVSPVDVTFQGDAGASGNMAITLSVNQVFTGALIVKSLHATATVTLATSTKTLSCTTLTLDTRGCLSQTGTAGNVTCTSFVQSGAGSVLTGKVDATFTCSGNASITAGTGTFSPATISGTFTVNGATAVLTQVATASLTITGLLTLTLGTITQAGYISVGAYAQAGGTLTGSVSYWFKVTNGNYVYTAGTQTASVLRVWFEGTCSFSSGDVIKALKNDGDLTLVSTCYIYGASSTNAEFYNSLNSTITVSPAKVLYFFEYLAENPIFQNNGVISGGTNYQAVSIIVRRNGNVNIAPGVITTSGVAINTPTGGVGNTTLTLVGNMVCNSLRFESSHPTNTLSLSLAGYALSCTNLTVNTRGVLSCGTSLIKCSGTLDTSLGTLTEGTSTFCLCGTGNVKLKAGDKFYNLIVKGTHTLTADATISRYYGYWKPLIKGAFTLTITDATKTYNQWMVYPRCNWKIEPRVFMDSQYLDRLIGQ
jgi:hypothetical protein